MQNYVFLSLSLVLALSFIVPLFHCYGFEIENPNLLIDQFVIECICVPMCSLSFNGIYTEIEYIKWKWIS